MTEHERELLEMAREHQKKFTPDEFRSWLRGFRLPGRESEDLGEELDKLLVEK